MAQAQQSTGSGALKLWDVTLGITQFPLKSSTPAMQRIKGIWSTGQCILSAFDEHICIIDRDFSSEDKQIPDVRPKDGQLHIVSFVDSAGGLIAGCQANLAGAFKHGLVQLNYGAEYKYTIVNGHFNMVTVGEKSDTIYGLKHAQTVSDTSYGLTHAQTVSDTSYGLTHEQTVSVFKYEPEKEARDEENAWSAVNDIVLDKPDGVDYTRIQVPGRRIVLAGQHFIHEYDMQGKFRASLDTTGIDKPLMFCRDDNDNVLLYADTVTPTFHVIAGNGKKYNLETSKPIGRRLVDATLLDDKIIALSSHASDLHPRQVLYVLETPRDASS